LFSAFLRESLLEILISEPDTAQMPDDWRGHRTSALFCPVRGRCRVVTGGDFAEIHPASALLLAPRTPYHVEFGASENPLLMIILISDRAKEILSEPATSGNFDVWRRIPLNAPTEMRDMSARLVGEILQKLYFDISSSQQDDSFVFAALRLLLVEVALNSDPQGNRIAGHMPAMQDNASKLVKQAMQYIDAHYRESIGLSEVSKELYVSASYLSRAFKNSYGIGFIEYINNKRVFEAKNLLVSTNMKISEIALNVGFSNIPYFNAIFKKLVKCGPREFRSRFN
jgi:AraC-like DNA-binding protein